MTSAVSEGDEAGIEAGDVERLERRKRQTAANPGSVEPTLTKASVPLPSARRHGSRFLAADLRPPTETGSGGQVGRRESAQSWRALLVDLAISAEKDVSGRWRISPVELFRVSPAVVKVVDNQPPTPTTVVDHGLQRELAFRDEKIALLD